MGTPEDVAADKVFTPPAWMETVMKPDVVIERIKAVYPCFDPEDDGHIPEFEKGLLEEQAKLSWTAGAKEALDVFRNILELSIQANEAAIEGKNVKAALLLGDCRQQLKNLEEEINRK